MRQACPVIGSREIRRLGGGPTLACFGDEDTWLALSSGAAAQAIPGAAVGTLDWRTFHVVAPLAECALVVLSAAAGARHLDELRELLSTHRALPVVVAAGRPLPPTTARVLRPRGALLGLPLDPAAVWESAQDACTRATLCAAAAAFGLDLGLDVRLRRALVLAAAGPVAISSVDALARAASCHRRTLWQAWRGTPAAARGLALHDVLDWFTLFRAYLGRPAAGTAGTWDGTAARLGVHRQTLAHLVARLAGVTLGHFAPNAVRRARSAFGESVLAPVLAARSGTMRPDSAPLAGG